MLLSLGGLKWLRFLRVCGSIRAMKIIELKKVPKNKIGKYNENGVDLKPHEKATIKLLTQYGFNIESIIPSNIPKAKNPDILMAGTVWEMKAPMKYNEETIRTKFRKAKKQANGRAVFDLRNVKELERVNKYIMSLFVDTSEMRRMIIIKSDNETLDIYK